jgi:hypothetical protein
MYLNSYSVRIANGNEVDGGYVEMEHGAQYSIVMRNAHDSKCDARVMIDGKLIGTFRISERNSMTLERKPGDDNGKFTFFLEGSKEAIAVNAPSGNANNGLVSVTFTPGKDKIRPIVTVSYDYWTYPPNTKWEHLTTDNTAQYRTTTNVNDIKGSDDVAVGAYCMSFAEPKQDFSAGITALTGHSDQGFYHVEELDYDYSGQTTINLRLVAKKESAVRPLIGMSNPIPPYTK